MKMPSRAMMLSLALLILPVPSKALAQEFYAGKTIRFIVGFAAGGGYDAYTRTVARYISRYIPDHPATVVENMEGAGSVIAAN
jgi:tripartite-type tricarboxylate transporter receptor subunit TctC